ncbi:hypothetical protein Tco_0016667 [Tanacetum coccineum]
MLGKTRASVPFITTSFAANNALLAAQLSALGFHVSPIAPSGPQAFYGARPNNNKSNNNNNRYNRNNSRGNNNRGRGNGRQYDWASTQNTVYGTCNRCGISHIPSQCPNRDPFTIYTRLSTNFVNTRGQSSNASANWHSNTGANSHVTPDLAAMDTSEAYYGDDALHVGNDKGLHILHIGLSKLSPTSQTSPESSNGQPSPISTTSIPIPLPSPPPPLPYITRQRLANLRQNPKQHVPYNPSANHATVLPTTITEPTSLTVSNNSPEWRQAIKEDINQLQDLSNLLAMHLSQRNTSSSPYSPNLPHTLNLDQVEQHVGYCPYIVNIIATSCAVSKSVDMSDCLPAKCCLELETEPFKQNDIIEKGVYDKLLKDFSSLEKHCISVELSQQLSQQNFQNQISCVNQDALAYLEFCEISNLKAQVQAKNTIISKLKEQIHSLKGTKNRKEVKKDIYEIETQNIEMENRVACLIKENEHLKQTYKNLFDSIKKKRNELRKLRGKDVIKNDASIPKAISIAPGMYKLDLEPLAPMLLKYKDAPIDYIKYTQTQAGILRGLVEQAKVLRPLDNSLDYALIGSTYDSGSKPTGNTKKSRISQPSSSKPKNKVKDQSRKFESNANKQNRVSKTICNATVKQSSSNANSESLCPTCNECVFSANHDMCVLDYVHNVYVRAKSKSKRNKKRKVWKPTSKVFTDIGYRWKPTKRTFTIDGNRVSTAKLRVSTAKLTVSTVRRKYYYCWFKITAVGEKVNAVESLLVVSTEVNVD